MQVVAPGTDTFVTSDVDITALKLTQNEHRNERKRVETYLDLVGLMILGLDPEGKIEFLNKKGCQVLGYAIPPVGRTWFDFIPERCQTEMREFFGLLTSGEGLIGDYVNPIVDVNGRERVIAWHNTVLKDHSGKVTGTLSSGEDITERKMAEETLLETKDTLESLINYANAPIIVWIRNWGRSVQSRFRTPHWV